MIDDFESESSLNTHTYAIFMPDTHTHNTHNDQLRCNNEYMRMILGENFQIETVSATWLTPHSDGSMTNWTCVDLLMKSRTQRIDANKSTSVFITKFLTVLF